MKAQIRISVFETNSSSVHTLVVMDHDDFIKWYHGDCYYNPEIKEFYSLEEGEELRKEYASNDKWFDGYNRWCDCPLTFQEWCPDDMETFDKVHTTKSGDTIKIFGYFGYDG